MNIFQVNESNIKSNAATAPKNESKTRSKKKIKAAPKPTSPTPRLEITHKQTNNDTQDAGNVAEKDNISSAFYSSVRAPEEDFLSESISVDDEISDAFQNLENQDELSPAHLKQASINTNNILNKQHKRDAYVTDKNAIKSTIEPEEKTETKTSRSAITNKDNNANNILEDNLFAHHDELIIEPLPTPAPAKTQLSNTQSKQKTLWSILSVIFFMLLVAQFSIKNFDRLSVDSRYRYAYSLVCKLNVCELPLQKDLSKIRANNLIIRPHSNYEKALVVDVIVNNLAQFEQDFPNIFLSFSNLQGKPVASRTFLPSEYLQGELSQLNLMPIKAPLHVSLEITDPGRHASSYHINFVDTK